MNQRSFHPCNKLHQDLSIDILGLLLNFLHQDCLIMSEQSPYIDIQWLDMYTRKIERKADGNLGPVGLHRGNIMDYFYTSPFYDINSCNESLRQKSSSWEEVNQELLKMTGIQFVLDSQNINEPNLFIIKRIRRINQLSHDTLFIYYCFDGVIYQGPGFTSLIHSRVIKSSYYLMQSYSIAENCAAYDESGHSVWVNNDESSETITDAINRTIANPSTGVFSTFYIPTDMPSFSSIKRDMLKDSFI